MVSLLSNFASKRQKCALVHVRWNISVDSLRRRWTSASHMDAGCMTRRPGIDHSHRHIVSYIKYQI